jgi:hypothetical protein
MAKEEVKTITRYYTEVDEIVIESATYQPGHTDVFTFRIDMTAVCGHSVHYSSDGSVSIQLDTSGGKALSYDHEVYEDVI